MFTNITKNELRLLTDIFRSDFLRLAEMGDFVEYPVGATIFLSGINHNPMTSELKPKVLIPEVKFSDWDKLVLKRAFPTFKGISI